MRSLREKTSLRVGTGIDLEALQDAVVVCSPKADCLAIIAAYVPDSSQWSADFRRRVT
jgi:hypothetical protein